MKEQKEDLDNESIILQLFEFIKLHDLKSIEAMNLHTKNIDINYRYNGYTLLYKAVLTRKLSIVEFFLNNFSNIDCNILCEFSKSQFHLPITTAMKNKDIAIVKILLDHHTTDLNSYCYKSPCANNGFLFSNMKDIILSNILLLKGANINEERSFLYTDTKKEIFRLLLCDLKNSNSTKNIFKVSKPTAINIINNLKEIKLFNEIDLKENISDLEYLNLPPKPSGPVAWGIGAIQRSSGYGSKHYKTQDEYEKLIEINIQYKELIDQLETLQNKFILNGTLITKDLSKSESILPWELIVKIFSYIKITDIRGIKEDTYKYCYEHLDQSEFQGLSGLGTDNICIDFC